MNTSITNTRPETTEYAADYQGYTNLVPDGNIVTTLERQLGETLALLRGIDEGRASYRYAPDKWSIKQLIGHVIDGERVFSYRALRFARSDSQPVPGFDQDEFMSGANFDERSLGDLINEYEHVRRATIDLFKPLTDEAWMRRGTASDNEVTVRALAHIVAGHELHHMQILKTRYLTSADGATA
jgi:DinB family protein